MPTHSRTQFPTGHKTDCLTMGDTSRQWCRWVSQGYMASTSSMWHQCTLTREHPPTLVRGLTETLLTWVLEDDVSGSPARPECSGQWIDVSGALGEGSPPPRFVCRSEMGPHEREHGSQ